MIKEFSQIGWFDQGSRRFEYTDIKDDRIKRGLGEGGYTTPVFAIDKGTASRLQITLELAATNSQQPLNAIALCKRAVIYSREVGDIPQGHPIVEEMAAVVAQ